MILLLLGWAEHLRRSGGRRHWRRLALSPLLFAAVLFSEGPLGLAGGLLALTAVPIWALTVESFAIADLAVTTPRGPWVAVYYYSFLALLMVAAAIPHRRAADD